MPRPRRTSGHEPAWASPRRRSTSSPTSTCTRSPSPTGRSTTWCATRRSSTRRSRSISSAGVVDDLEVDVYAFGLITDFRGELFEGTKRLLEIADERVPLQVEARCWCGSRATHNARVVNGVLVYEGETVMVGDTADAVGATALRRHRALRAALPPPLPRRRPRHLTGHHEPPERVRSSLLPIAATRRLGQTVRGVLGGYSRRRGSNVALGGWPDEQLPCRYSGGNPRWADDLAGGVTRALRAQTPVALAGGGRGGVRGRQCDPEARRLELLDSVPGAVPGYENPVVFEAPELLPLHWVNIAWIAARFAIVLWTAAIAVVAIRTASRIDDGASDQADRRRRRRHDDRGAGRRGAARGTVRRRACCGAGPSPRTPAGCVVAGRASIAPPASGSIRRSGWRWPR